LHGTYRVGRIEVANRRTSAERIHWP
jgi:hypothetical protein